MNFGYRAEVTLGVRIWLGGWNKASCYTKSSKREEKKRKEKKRKALLGASKGFLPIRLIRLGLFIHQLSGFPISALHFVKHFWVGDITLSK
jgi:hypothetical protein